MLVACEFKNACLWKMTVSLNTDVQSACEEKARQDKRLINLLQLGLGYHTIIAWWRLVITTLSSKAYIGISDFYTAPY